MLFGLCNAPATLKRIMHRVLSGLEGKGNHVYIDDILVASKSFEENLKHLREVFSKLREACLHLKPKKCGLLRPKVPYVISAQGVYPDPEKTEKVRLYPQPADVAGIQRFLGFASYYRRFILKFASIASPLHALTRKNVPFKWTPECQQAFEELKRLLTTAPVLAYPMFGPGRSFIRPMLALLDWEQSYHKFKKMVPSIPLHKHPVLWTSMRNISELEMLGLVWAVRYFRSYLLGHPCTVYTDHAACLLILNTAKPSGKLARWALTIQEMDLTIKHKPGKKNINADTLPLTLSCSCCS